MERKKESELVKIGTFWPHPVECSPETIEDRGNPSSESLNTTRKEDQNCMKNANYLKILYLLNRRNFVNFGLCRAI